MNSNKGLSKAHNTILKYIKDKYRSSLKNNIVIEVKDSNDINMDYIFTINSGMTIKSNVFDEFSYNENNFLDYADHYFIKEMVKQYKNNEG